MHAPANRGEERLSIWLPPVLLHTFVLGWETYIVSWPAVLCLYFMLSPTFR